jgi:hypothetical protein
MVNVFPSNLFPRRGSFESENVVLMFLLSFRGSGLVTSSATVGGGRRPLPVPRSCGTGPGAPPPTAAEVAQASRQSLRRNTRKPKGEAGKQRASESPLFMPLSLAGASMKIWCFRNRDPAIKWRALLVVDEPTTLAYMPITYLG